MKDPTFVIQLGVVLAAALAGGLLARFARLPILVGYLLAGIFVGPHTPGLLADLDTVQNIANVGVVLLMFAVGVQFSLKELGSIRRTALISGSAQILGTATLGLGVGTALGWTFAESFILGCALALSSTAVMLKFLEERGELGSTHGAILMGILVVQDLSLVAVMCLLPVGAMLAKGEAASFDSVAWAVAQSVLFIVVTLLLATRLVPRLMDRVTRTGSPELFLLTVVCLCFGAAVVADLAGLGMALGAFLAGVVVSESPYAHEIFSQVRPLRDVFSSIFFVSIGMLADPAFVVAQWPTVLAVVLTILLGKGLLSILAVQAMGWHSRTAFLVGAGLTNVGEFSFVLAGAAATAGLVGPRVSSTVVAAALVTLFAAPFVYGAASRIYYGLARTRLLRPWLHRGDVEYQPGDTHRGLQPRVLVLGGGRVGRYTSEALREKNVPHLIVDYDSEAIDKARERNVPVLYGDASSKVLLDRVRPEKAELAVVALPEAAVTEMAVKALRELAPDLPIVARVRRGVDIPRMRAAGATAVVHGEFEAGTETIRRSLERLGFPIEDIEDYIGSVRAVRYRQETIPH